MKATLALLTVLASVYAHAAGGFYVDNVQNHSMTAYNCTIENRSSLSLISKEGAEQKVVLPATQIILKADTARDAVAAITGGLIAQNLGQASQLDLRNVDISCLEK